MTDNSKIIYTTEIEKEDLEAAKEWLLENLEEGDEEPDDDEVYEEARDQKDLEWDDLEYNFKEYDEKHPNSTYVIEGRRVTSPTYAAYIGRGGEYVPVKTNSFKEAIYKCVDCGDYGITISETPGGVFEIETYDHDGHCEFEIYRVEKRRYNIKFRKEIWGCK